MFDPTNLQQIRQWRDADLAGHLLTAEDERHEFKSSLTSDTDLAGKIGKAASGFWNSGGGLFVAGVDGTGSPDGGIADTVSRQPRREWIDQHIGRLAPRGDYVVHAISDQGACLRIQPWI